MATTRPLPPMWVMGLGFLPLGASGSLMLITLPQLLAAKHVPEQTISLVTTAALAPGVLSFLLGPLLDWRFSRRSYAIGFTILAAATMLAALMCLDHLLLLSVLLFISGIAVGLVVASVGGWFGNLTSPEQKDRLGAWLSVANLGFGGVVASLAIPALRQLPYALGAALLCLIIVAAIPLYLWVPCPPADDRLASESFREFTGEVMTLLGRSTVLWTLPLFLLPAASFALTNLLGGVGRDFSASETFVGLIGGIGVSVAGVVGSLLAPPVTRLISARPFYLLIGGAGAAFTLALTILPHTTTVFTLAMLGENMFQAAAFAMGNVIILRTIGHDNPLAATQFSLLNCASMLPLTYMQFVDGQAYGHGGVNGSFMADALISAAACAGLALLLWRFRRRVPVI